MVKVFFADAGTLEQLAGNLAEIERDAVDRLQRLAGMAAGDPGEFRHRLHLSAIGLRLQAEQELAVLRWSRWAQEQVSQWVGSDDPGRWDAAGALEELVARVGSATGARPS